MRGAAVCDLPPEHPPIPYREKGINNKNRYEEGQPYPAGRLLPEAACAQDDEERTADGRPAAGSSQA